MNQPRFEILLGSATVRGHAYYVVDDHAFNFRLDTNEQKDRKGVGGTTSFVVDTLQLEVAVDSSLCLYVWGYCPLGKWKQSSLTPPSASLGGLRVRYDKPLVPGVSIGLEDMVPTQARFDPCSGWFCMGDDRNVPNAQAIEFATGCIAVIGADGRLASIWVKPENWKEVASKFSSFQ